MKKLKTLLCGLLIVMLSACEEQPIQTNPNPVDGAIKLTRLELTHEQTGRTSVTEFTYENDLLVKEDQDGDVTDYFYQDDVLTRKVWVSQSGVTRTTTYTYLQDRLLETVTLADDSGNSSTKLSEYIEESESQMRINYYHVRGGENELFGYTICQIEDGNVVSEDGYDASDNPDGFSGISAFSTAINPYSLWKGHPQLQSRNLEVLTETYINNELSQGSYVDNIQLNENNLPTQFEMSCDSSLSNLRTLSFFYED